MGAEIKRDGKFRETGNLYIEVAEKAHPNNGNYVPSGICREDNSWLYIIGDEKTFYVLSPKILRMMTGRYKHVQTPTSKGFLLPVRDAEKYCLLKIEEKQKTLV